MTLRKLYTFGIVSKDILAAVRDPQAWSGQVLDLSRGLIISGGQLRQLGDVLRLAAEVRINTYQVAWLPNF